MTSALLNQLNTEQIIANEEWPEDAALYQPYDAEQILLAESASCLAVKTFLKMCDLPFTVQTCANAEFMSPGGRMTKLPFIKVGAFVEAEFEPIVTLVSHKGILLSNWLDDTEKSDMRAHIALVENIFPNAELYISFMDNSVLEQVTYPRNGCVFPWPLNHYQNWRKRQHVIKQLGVFDWLDMSIDEVSEKVKKCCATLSRKLENNSYFFGKPTELDAVTFGHLFTILTTNLPNNILANEVNSFNNLKKFCDNIESSYFGRN